MPSERQQHKSRVETDVPCPACGMFRDEWPDEGYAKNGQTFCCRGCADGTGCTCVDVTTANEGATV